VGRPAGAANVDGAVAGVSVYRGHMAVEGGGLGHDVEDSGRSGPTRMVVEEARALWTPRHRVPAWLRGEGGLGHWAPAWVRSRRNDVRAPVGRWTARSQASGSPMTMADLNRACGCVSERVGVRGLPWVCGWR
jgi:hypothetical protein